MAVFFFVVAVFFFIVTVFFFIVTVFVAVASMVVVSAASHFENGHCEIFWMFCGEFKDILAFFEVEDGNHGVCWATHWIGDGFLGLNVSMTFVFTIVIVMIIMAVFIMAVVFVFIMIFFIAVAIVVFLMEFHVECGVLGMNFDVISVLFFISEFNNFVRALRKGLTQVSHKHAFVVEGVLASWHGVDLDGGRCIRTERRECCLNPRFKSESVVKEDISVLEANNIRCGRFVIVCRDIVQAHVFNCHIVSSNCFDKFSDVVCRNHHSFIVVRIVS